MVSNSIPMFYRDTKHANYQLYTDSGDIFGISILDNELLFLLFFFIISSLWYYKYVWRKIANEYYKYISLISIPIILIVAYCTRGSSRIHYQAVETHKIFHINAVKAINSNSWNQSIWKHSGGTKIHKDFKGIDPGKIT